MNRNRKILTPILIFAMISTVFISLPVVKASAIDDALDLALQYLDRSYCLFNATHAAMRDLPGLPLTMRKTSNNHWYCPAKKTEAVLDNNDGPDFGYYGGGRIDVLDPGYDKSYTILKYAFDTEEDSSMDGITLNVTLNAVNNNTLGITIKCIDKQDFAYMELYLDNEILWSGSGSGWTIGPITNTNYGWFTTRYVVRHGTKIAANMYYRLGQTAKANSLVNTWGASGYSLDIYDPMWEYSNTYPDYIDDPITGHTKQWLATSVVFPDPEIWGNIPWYHSPEGSGVPYRSQLHLFASRNIMLMLTCPPWTPDQANWWELGFTCKLNWAMHLMNKYGTSDPSKLAEAKLIIDSVPWNGLGINSECNYWMGQLIRLWPYSCYVTYLTAMYLRTLTKYYMLTGDSFYAQRADKVAGIILSVQVKPGEKIKVNDGTSIRQIWRPDHTGGFLCGFKFGGGFEWANTAFWFADIMYDTLSGKMGPVGWQGIYHRDLPELSGMGWTNHETTLLCYCALWYYRQLNRTPESGLSGYNLPIYQAALDITRSECGIAIWEIDNQGHIRCNVVGDPLHGETWVKAVYTWPVSFTHWVPTFQTNIKGYIPHTDGSDGNSVEIKVEIYKEGDLYFSESRKPVDGVLFSGEQYFIYENMTICRLSPGNYQIMLSIRISCGGWGSLTVGNLISGPRWVGEPMWIEAFGYDAQTPTFAMKTRDNTQFYTPNGTRKIKHLRVEKFWNCSWGDGDQAGATSTAYPHFRQWIPDAKIDGKDIGALTAIYGAKEGENNWIYMGDVEPNRQIDGLDLAVVIANYGHNVIYITPENWWITFYPSQVRKYVDAQGFIEWVEGSTRFEIWQYYSGVGMERIGGWIIFFTEAGLG
jgi:hypothetical protein